MEILPITEKNSEFIDNPLCREILFMTLDFYKITGFVPPWIGYFVRENGDLVGSGAFKGQPINGIVEIAYGTFEKYRNQGIGAAICNALVNLSLQTDPTVKIRARTLPEKNFSTRILQKNNFHLLGTVIDLEDGEVWEWEYKSIQ